MSVRRATATWWNTIEIELKMVDVRTSQVYLSGYAGGRWFYTFSDELLFERIFEQLFEELSDQITKRRARKPEQTARAPVPQAEEAKQSAGG